MEIEIHFVNTELNKKKGNNNLLFQRIFQSLPEKVKLEYRKYKPSM